MNADEIARNARGKLGWSPAQMVVKYYIPSEMRQIGVYEFYCANKEDEFISRTRSDDEKNIQLFLDKYFKLGYAIWIRFKLANNWNEAEEMLEDPVHFDWTIRLKEVENLCDVFKLTQRDPRVEQLVVSFPFYQS